MSTARPLRRSEAAPTRAPGRRSHLQVVDSPPEPRRRAKGPVLVVVASLVTVFLALFGLVVFHTVLVQNQSEIDDLDARLVAERELIKETRLEIAELESPDRVIAAAQSLGLIAPDEVVMLDAVELGPPPSPDVWSGPAGVEGVGVHEQAGADAADGGATP